MEYSNSLINELGIQDIEEVLRISQHLIQTSDSQVCQTLYFSFFSNDSIKKKSVIVAKLLNRLSYGCTYDEAKKIIRFLSDHIIPDSSLTQTVYYN